MPQEIKINQEELQKQISALKERLEVIEGLMNLIVENQKEIKQLLNEQIKRINSILEKSEDRGMKSVSERKSEDRGSDGGRRGKKTLLETLEALKYLEIDEVRARATLNKLIEQGDVVRLDVAGKTIVAAKTTIRNLLSRMPLSINDAAEMDKREYDLLRILNELGYVIKKDDKYVATELAKEFL